MTLALGMLLGRAALAAEPDSSGTIAPVGTSTAAGAEAAAYEARRIERHLSWSALAAGIPQQGMLARAELGFSGLPQLSLEKAIAPNMSVGGLLAFDYGDRRPSRSFTPAFVLAVPVRYDLPIAAGLVAGLRGHVGLEVPGGAGVGTALMLGAAAHVGFNLEGHLLIGGGLEMPVLLGLSGARPVLVLPVLAGPFAELHILPQFAVTLDVKAGPDFATSPEGTGVGLKAMVGIAYLL